MAKDLLAGQQLSAPKLTLRVGTTCRFPPRPVRYLRVRVTHNSANTGCHLVEVMAFEK